MTCALRKVNIHETKTHLSRLAGGATDRSCESGLEEVTFRIGRAYNPDWTTYQSELDEALI